jgi:hypothetical protein
MTMNAKKRKRETVFLGDEVGEYLEGLLASTGRKNAGIKAGKTARTAESKVVTKSLNLLACWQNVAPPRLLQHTDNVVYAKPSKSSNLSRIDRNPQEPQGVELLIYTDTPAYAAELNMDKELYRIKMQQELGKEIVDITFLVSRKAGRYRSYKG